MFSLRICRYSLGKLTTEILKMLEKYKIYQNKKHQGSLGWESGENICAGGWDLTKFKIFSKASQGRGCNTWT